MEIGQQFAEELGFPKAHYRVVERERRWLCRKVPDQLVKNIERINDLYVAGTRLRLREARPVDGSPARLRLSRKADADDRTRLISSIYLSEDDFSVLSRTLEGLRVVKLRYRLHSAPGISLCVDEFEGPLSGLLIAEAEFGDDEAMAAFSAPDFAECEITDNPRFSGHALASLGLP